MVAKAALPTGLALLLYFVGAAGAATAGAAPPHRIAALPSAPRPTLDRALARAGGRHFAIATDGCVNLGAQHLGVCFEKGGVRLNVRAASARMLRLTAWGRTGATRPVAPAVPLFANGRVSYRYGTLDEWWRILPHGIEQGFTIARRPAGNGGLVLALSAGAGAGEVRHGTLALGRLRYGNLVVTDARGKTVPSTLSTKNGSILIAVDDAGARYPLTVDPLVWVGRSVTESGGGNVHFFGEDVALTAATAFVGASGTTVNGNADQGVVYVFTRSAGVWSETQVLTASDGTAGQGFGSAVAISGTTAVVGAYGDSGKGAAYVFTESAGSWSQKQKLTVSGGTGQFFGVRVALQGSTAVITAPYAATGGHAKQGAAYVFTESGGTWSEAQELTASDGVADEEFGWSVALAGNTALLGAPYDDIGRNAGQGAVYVFRDSSGVWKQKAKVTAPDGTANGHFGTALALSGNTALAGNPSNAFAKGAVYVYVRANRTWHYAQKLTASDANDGNGFGSAVSLAGTAALVGAPNAFGGATGEGEAYVFVDSNGVWSQVKKIHPPLPFSDAKYGEALALIGATALVGAPQEKPPYGNKAQGAAYFYNATCPQGYDEYDGAISPGRVYASPSYQAPAGSENAILGAPGGAALNVVYSGAKGRAVYLISGNEVHARGPAGTYRWAFKTGDFAGNYVLCVLHP